MDERYAIIKRLDRYFVSLKAGNHQEIARSGPFETEEMARLIFPSERAKAAAAEALRLKAEEEAAAAERGNPRGTKTWNFAAANVR
ncbi:MAG: hypothetical protein HC817_04930, partial [Saprospiraceae bacterium]|nr:hypothetical protein [Saprospiraceae bacterium]